ncbi:MAG: hypothetical protein KCHDKBKB_01275 [Elusimicrobia bacterium]|nr:hypothetical protein [Elusimicrobiota bacterium]
MPLIPPSVWVRELVTITVSPEAVATIEGWPEVAWALIITLFNVKLPSTSTENIVELEQQCVSLGSNSTVPPLGVKLAPLATVKMVWSGGLESVGPIVNVPVGAINVPKVNVNDPTLSAVVPTSGETVLLVLISIYGPIPPDE